MLYNMPIIKALSLNGFKRGIILAQSLKTQRQYLAKAKLALKEKDVYKANVMLSCFKDERKAWSTLVGFSGKKASSFANFI